MYCFKDGLGFSEVGNITITVADEDYVAELYVCDNNHYVATWDDNDLVIEGEEEESGDLVIYDYDYVS